MAGFVTRFSLPIATVPLAGVRVHIFRSTESGAFQRPVAEWHSTFCLRPAARDSASVALDVYLLAAPDLAIPIVRGDGCARPGALCLCNVFRCFVNKVSCDRTGHREANSATWVFASMRWKETRSTSRHVRDADIGAGADARDRPGVADPTDPGMTADASAPPCAASLRPAREPPIEGCESTRGRTVCTPCFRTPRPTRVLPSPGRDRIRSVRRPGSRHRSRAVRLGLSVSSVCIPAPPASRLRLLRFAVTPLSRRRVSVDRAAAEN